MNNCCCVILLRNLILIVGFFVSQTVLNRIYQQGLNFSWNAAETAQKKVDNALACFEEGLNIAGYVPLFGLCITAGALRIQYGKTLVCTSIALAALVAVASIFTRNSEMRHAGFKLASKLFTVYSLHGLANICRGFIEIFPYLSLITCLPYDMTNNRLKYPTEVPGRWVYVTS